MALVKRNIDKEIKELAEMNLSDDFKALEADIKKREKDINYAINYRKHEVTLADLGKTIVRHNEEIDKLMAGE